MSRSFGAGPVGAVMAFEWLTKVFVFCFLKRELPRKKVCAGGITVRAASLLPFDFNEVIENVIYGVRLSYHLWLKG
jgi:hypothetical protein